jgi:hypothetical protein
MRPVGGGVGLLPDTLSDQSLTEVSIDPGSSGLATELPTGQSTFLHADKYRVSEFSRLYRRNGGPTDAEHQDTGWLHNSGISWFAKE